MTSTVASSIRRAARATRAALALAQCGGACARSFARADGGELARARAQSARMMNQSMRRASTLSSSAPADADEYSRSLAARAAYARSQANTRGEASSERVGATMRADGTAPKFYDVVNVERSSDGWHVILDGRRLRTPNRGTYVFASKALAVAVGDEWNAQEESIAPFTMPLTGLSATALDHMHDAETRHLHIETLIKHFATDVVRVRSLDEAIAAKQAEIHDPIIKWARKEFGAVDVSDSIFGPAQNEKTSDVIRKRLHGMCPWELTCAFALCASTKSLLIGLMTLRGELTVDEAIAAARVEEEMQIAEWGLVEGGHDLDQLDIRVRVTAPVMLMKFRAMKDDA